MPIQPRLDRFAGVMLLGFLALTACSPASQVELQATQVEPAAEAESIETLDEPDGEAVVPAAADPTRFVILGDGTEARFVIDEILRGEPKTVVGVTNEVSGHIVFDIQDPALSSVGEISIAADSFITDNSFRNGAIQRFILQTNQYEVITFRPTSIEGLPATVGLQEPVNLTIVGDLTIRDVTRPVQFETEVTAVADNRLVGFASVQILRSDFGLNIPEVPQVAGVEDEFLLEFEFTAQSS